MIDYKKTGECIKHMRKALGITQEELAEKTDISVRYISKIENGSDNISCNILDSLATFFSCNVKDLLIEAIEVNTSDDDENKEYRSIIAATNYTNLSPYRDISTFSELFLVIPLIDYSDLLECCLLVDGVIFRKEDYISQVIDRAWKFVKPSLAKDYVQYILDMIKSYSKSIHDSSIIDSLFEKYDELDWTDSDFLEKKTAYISEIERKKKIADDLRRLKLNMQ